MPKDTPPDLRPHLNTNQLIRVTMNGSDTAILGFLLGLSNKLAMFHTVDDFDPDGFVIVRTEDIESVQRTEFETHWQTLLEREGALAGLNNPPKINLATLPDALKSVAAQYPHMIVESEEFEGEGEDEDETWITFHLGVLLGTHDGFAELHGYDSLGVWAEKPSIVWYTQITAVKFDSRYANTFWKHIPARPQR